MEIWKFFVLLAILNIADYINYLVEDWYSYKKYKEYSRNLLNEFTSIVNGCTIIGIIIWLIYLFITKV